MLAWSGAWTTLLPLRKTLSAFHFRICQLLKQHVLPCTGYVLQISVPKCYRDINHVF